MLGVVNSLSVFLIFTRHRSQSSGLIEIDPISGFAKVYKENDLYGAQISMTQNAE